MKKQEYTLFLDEGNPPLADADAAVLGVAFDKTGSYEKGSAKAPAAVFRASHQLELEQPLTGKTLDTAIHNMGIIEPKTSEQMVEKTREKAENAIGAGKFFILLGGDHSVVNGLLAVLPKDVSFVNFDAHLDLRESWLGTRLNHACVARRIFDAGFGQLWVGARDQISEEEIGFVSAQTLAEKIFYCATQPKSFYKTFAYPEWIKKENVISGGMPGELQMQKVLDGIGERDVWLNIDIDCLDSRELHGTGTPVPFGLKLEGLNELLFRIISAKNVIGFNLVELIPSRKDLNSEMIAAMLCYNILSWKFSSNKGPGQ